MAAAQVATRRILGCGEPLTLTYRAPAGSTATPSDFGPARGPVVERAFAQHAQWVTTMTCRAEPKRVQPKRHPYMTTTSPNYAGYVTYTNAPWNAQAMWTVPFVSSNGYDPADSAIWPGMGGWTGSGELIQDGSSQNVSASNIPDIFFWFELFPLESSQRITNMSPHSGDSVGASATYSRGTAYFTICDYTQNICGYGSQSSPAPSLAYPGGLDSTGTAFTDYWRSYG